MNNKKTGPFHIGPLFTLKIGKRTLHPVYPAIDCCCVDEHTNIPKEEKNNADLSSSCNADVYS